LEVKGVLLLEIGDREDLRENLLQPFALALLGEHARLDEAVEGVDLHVKQIRQVEIKAAGGVRSTFGHVSQLPWLRHGPRAARFCPVTYATTKAPGSGWRPAALETKEAFRSAERTERFPD